MDLHGSTARPGVRRGFTLVEAALATAIIGIGFVSMLRLYAACTRDNAAGAQMTVALMLASSIQELMANLSFNDPGSASLVFGPEPGETLSSFDDLDDFDLLTFDPPINASRTAISDLARYSQVVSVMPVNPHQPGGNTSETSPDIPKTAYTGAVRVRVRVLYRPSPAATPQEVYRLSWIRFDE